MSETVPTPEQTAAIDYPHSLVAIAKPGSGKTFVLARKIRNVLGRLPNHKGVIAISYTNKASDELRRRTTANGVNVKASFFGTIDKFCLSEIVIPFLAHLWGNPVSEVAILRWRDLPPEEQAEFEDIQEKQVSLEDLVKYSTSLKARFLKGQLFLEASGALALFALKNSKACRRYISARYSHVIIDEYQDSGLEQHGLFLELQSMGLIAVAVGDADQSIFGFSNKDSKYLLELAKHAGFKTFPITFNHRCHPSIINYSMRLIDEHATLSPTANISVFYKSCVGNAAAIATWIESVLPNVMATYSVNTAKEIGILVRGGASGALLDGALTFKHRYFLTHPLEEHFGLWSRLFAQLLTYRYDEHHAAQTVIDRFSTGLKEKEIRAARNLIKNLRECGDTELFAHMEAIATMLLPNARKDESLALLRNSKITDLARAFSPAAEDEIQVMSLHKAKGLEFDVVFHLDLYEWVLPAKAPGPGNDFDNPDYPSWQQDVNLHYVGVTRARKACFLCSSTKRINRNGIEKNGKPSEFLGINNLSSLRLANPF
jgi:superfamily I DNA/RNA helicase